MLELGSHGTAEATSTDPGICAWINHSGLLRGDKGVRLDVVEGELGVKVTDRIRP